MTDHHQQRHNAQRAHGPAGPGAFADDPSRPAEDQLRALLHQAVADIRPAPDGLARIGREVPRRRTRHRHAWVAGSAAVLLVGAVPAIGSAVNFTSSTAADRSAAPPSAPPSPTPAAGLGWTRPPRLGDPAAVPTLTADLSGSPTTAPPSAIASATAAVPGCAGGDLGQAASGVSAPDGSGQVSGWFTVRNVSSHSCLLTGPGTVTVSAASGIDPGKVRVVDHTAGDPAARLPDPAPAPVQLVLPPGTAYQEQFAYVPDRSCGEGGDQPQASPSPGARAADVPATPPSATASSSPTGTGATPAATLTLTHTPQPDSAPLATAVLAVSCSGTVYRTAPQPAPAASPSASPSGPPPSAAQSSPDATPGSKPE